MLGPIKFASKNIFPPTKFCNQQNLAAKIFVMSKKNFGCEKNFECEKYFECEKILGPRKTMGEKHFGSKNILCPPKKIESVKNGERILFVQ